MRQNKSIEFGALKIFDMVSKSDTLTNAADKLGITQSAVSQAIKQLEELSQVKLIVRRSRPIKLTPSGLVLKNYATRILGDTGRMMNDVKLASKGGLLNLKVGMIDSFGDSLGLEFISKIHPFVAKTALRTGLTTSLTEAFHNHDLDILITSDTIDNQLGLVKLALIRDPFLIIAPEISLAEGTVTIQQIASSLPFIHYNPQSQIGRQTDLIARRVGVELDTHYELDSTQTLMRFVQANRGWAIISALCLVRYRFLLKGVRVMNLDNGANARAITQVSRKDELGDLPQKFAKISRQIFNHEIAPKLATIAPWLPKQAYSIDKI